MSNFASLHFTRQSKESKLYVKPNKKTEKVTLPQPSSNEGPDIEKFVPVVHVLPPSVEVWLSNTHGRGLRTKTQRKPGICSLFESVLTRSHLETDYPTRIRRRPVLRQASRRHALESTSGHILYPLLRIPAFCQFETMY